MIADYPVFMVEKRSCPFCKTAKVVSHSLNPSKHCDTILNTSFQSVLNSYDIPDEFIKIKDISGDPQASEIQVQILHTPS